SERCIRARCYAPKISSDLCFSSLGYLKYLPNNAMHLKNPLTPENRCILQGGQKRKTLKIK
ncbi:MAG: hypothetical protein K2J42_01325, partial [Muribaculaceae bacterium]|nr:hypothetical protein [Muribaculaceae bacterium]